MNATLQSAGLFASRKRRPGGFAGGPKQEVKRPLPAEKSRYGGGRSSSPTPSVGGGSFSGPAAGAVAPPGSMGNNHAQDAIHKEVQYSREGEDKKVAGPKLEVFRFVKKAFVVPDGFEKDHKFGPLSGVSYELRVISAYMSGQLEARSKADARVKMCLECGKKGHFPRHCPATLLYQ